MEMTYAVQHPGMSHALLMSCSTERIEQSLAAHAAVYMLREFDVVLPVHEFLVVEVDADQDVELDLFQEA